ncbi:MAG: [FeFe] hydrogenase H-cluster radical SAM maturase HydE [Melioribacteraceae bacterium]|nr:[FeFe] hydrogenase H-cluster radical SAM maturase HydE [Melioribacteraceae bacterium]
MLTKEEIIAYLQTSDEESQKELFEKASQVKTNLLGKNVYLRGIIELSNICQKDCYYCGIRKSNKNVNRYLMIEDEILKSAEWAYKAGYASIVLQSGERTDDKFVRTISDVLKEIKKLSDGKLRVTLSLGEQEKEVYKCWYNLGAHRYLLRIESSNKDLYHFIHPKEYSFEKRLECLNNLKEIGYQLGTGVMIGLPHQTYEDLANDILFFKKLDVDMVGMGPYLEHKDTPLPDKDTIIVKNKEELYHLGLRMISVLRLTMPTINIAATTALQALNSFGREKGILCGANVFMPNISEGEYRPSYQLYDNKPCIDETSTECLDCVGKRIEMIGEKVAFDEWGDSLHFRERNC